ncbi:MAG: hypothetical protein IPQ07_45790 [Myxococcales bacterium]|nr:hypothetical protein [Myxococcales bacterium]
MTRLSWLVLGLMFGGCVEHGSGGPTSDGGSGRLCGGFGGGVCGANEFCDFGRNTCGASDESGTCRSKPSGCTDNFDPVCGCDHLVHSNECDAQAVGVDVDASGACPVTTGTFACGFRTCQTASQYCQRGVSDIGGEPDTFTCKPLPGTCGVGGASCTCLAAEACGSFCAGAGTSGLTLTCPGG